MTQKVSWVEGPANGPKRERQSDPGRAASERGPGRPRKNATPPVMHPRHLRVLLGERQAEAAASAWLGVPLRELRQASRGAAPIAEARQVGMYLAHTVLRRSMTRVGQVFGRDRTTVRHACACVEDRRDSVALDLALDVLGTALDRWSAELAARLADGGDGS